MVTLSLLPLVQAILNGFLLAKGVALVAQLYLFSGQPQTLQDGFAFPSTLSADVLPEEDSVVRTTCTMKTEGGTPLNWCCSWPLPLQQVKCHVMLHMNRTQAHIITHSALAVTEGPCHLQLPQDSWQLPSHLHTPSNRSLRLSGRVPNT